MLLCVSVRPTRLPRLSTRLAPGKPEEQGAGWGFSPLFLQAPKQSAHRALQRLQPQRQQQVPGVQRAGQIKQGSVVILTHTDTPQQPLYKVLGTASSVEPNKVAVLLCPLSCSDPSLPEDWWQIWHHQLQSRLPVRRAGPPCDATRQRVAARPRSPQHLRGLQTGAHFEWSARCVWVPSTRSKQSGAQKLAGTWTGEFASVKLRAIIEGLLNDVLDCNDQEHRARLQLLFYFLGQGNRFEAGDRGHYRQCGHTAGL